jgi:VIT1/CCC1 family predicted Fe2+/Mn2+ transporter
LPAFLRLCVDHAMLSSMARSTRHKEKHRSTRIGWLRAAVLGANDGIVSTASIVVGVAAAGTDHQTILLSGVAGLVAGAMSMAAGEYVSVHSQSDTENADLSRERKELREDPAAELHELQRIYMHRGLKAELAQQVAEQLTQHDALGAHARDELGITPEQKPRPVQAALTSAASFTTGAALPLGMALIAPVQHAIWVISGASLVSLGLLGALAAHAGGASKLKGAWRVTFWSAAAMAATAGVGSLFGTPAV